jgi:hypothetical protein
VAIWVEGQISKMLFTLVAGVYLGEGQISKMLLTLDTGGYLGGGSAGYWSPYGYPLLLPPSLSHYQHYHNQLLLLQQAALLSPAHASASQVLRRPITRGHQLFFDQ